MDLRTHEGCLCVMAPVLAHGAFHSSALQPFRVRGAGRVLDPCGRKDKGKTQVLGGSDQGLGSPLG